MVMENRPVDPGSIQGSHRPISFIRIKHRTRANDNLCKCLMYHAACKVEFQPFTRSYSQLTFFNFYKIGEEPENRKVEGAKRPRPFTAFRQKSLFIAGRTSIGCQKINKKHNFLYTSLIQHRHWPLRSTIFDADGTNASPDGLCTRTHSNEAFSCCFCCISFRDDRARRGNVCL